MIASSYTGSLPSPLNFLDTRRPLDQIRHSLTFFNENFLPAVPANGRTGGPRAIRRPWTPRSFFNVPLVLMVLWILTLWWGERNTFKRKIADCTWSRWEHRTPESNPHHVILIADPQLVDPHTYPGRPWPLSTLTILHTDAYLRKAFAIMQRQLMPDTVIFLGDLFDGGREWSTERAEAGDDHISDTRWRKYGDSFWLKEYDRFGKIFLEPWLQTRYRRPGQPGRRLIAELPGNHDLGFGLGIRLPVRKRFNAYFGEGNRMDRIGNFTFVSIDSVSLSANGQPNVVTGTQGADLEDDSVQRIWHPTEEFLSGVKEQKARLLNRELRRRTGLSEVEPHDHIIQELVDVRHGETPNVAQLNASIPSILLTHVPLYRLPGTPCGKLREKYPPSTTALGEDGTLEKDVKNALPVMAGLQYQTVLTPAISDEIVEKVGDIEAVFSGDDHDYCEVTHRGYSSRNGGIKEITLKAISPTASVRKPGFLMLSLWNPIDAQGNRIGVGDASSDDNALQTHLCLLPDQLSILKRYGILLGLTLATLLAHAVTQVSGDSKPLRLDHKPLSRRHHSSSPPVEPERGAASVWSASNGLAARSAVVGRMRSADPENGYPSGSYANGYAMPGSGFVRPSSGDGTYDSGRGSDWNQVSLDDDDHSSKRKTTNRLSAILVRWIVSLRQVTAVVVIWYLLLRWTT